MADGRRIENHFLDITQLHVKGRNAKTPIKMKFGVRRQKHAYEAVQMIKCLLRKSKIADVNILKMDMPPYLSRESSKVDEMWYTNTNFDTAEET